MRECRCRSSCATPCAGCTEALTARMQHPTRLPLTHALLRDPLGPAGTPAAGAEVCRGHDRCLAAGRLAAARPTPGVRGDRRAAGRAAERQPITVQGAGAQRRSDPRRRHRRAADDGAGPAELGGAGRRGRGDADRLGAARLDRRRQPGRDLGRAGTGAGCVESRLRAGPHHRDADRRGDRLRGERPDRAARARSPGPARHRDAGPRTRGVPRPSRRRPAHHPHRNPNCRS
ncbi:hypothetical protein QF046_001989 [Microbacterium sp. W4I4]|nr:hypothetical protein [Microbacterium sp. W4I4]